MPVSEPRTSYHHGDLRAALIATSLDLTRAGGPDALRVREVTRHIGVSPNAAYRHFANHRALLAAVAADIQDRMAQSMREKMTTRARDATGRAVAGVPRGRLGYRGYGFPPPRWVPPRFFFSHGRPAQRGGGRPAPPAGPPPRLWMKSCCASL